MVGSSPGVIESERVKGMTDKNTGDLMRQWHPTQLLELANIDFSDLDALLVESLKLGREFVGSRLDLAVVRRKRLILANYLVTQRSSTANTILLDLVGELIVQGFQTQRQALNKSGGMVDTILDFAYVRATTSALLPFDTECVSQSFGFVQLFLVLLDQFNSGHFHLLFNRFNRSRNALGWVFDPTGRPEPLRAGWPGWKRPFMSLAMGCAVPTSNALAIRVFLVSSVQAVACELVIFELGVGLEIQIKNSCQRILSLLVRGLEGGKFSSEFLHRRNHCFK